MQDATQQPGSVDEELRTQTLEMLDFPAIREIVANSARVPAARDLALGLTPAYSTHEVEILQKETAEGLRFLDVSGDVDLYSTGDASVALTRAALGGTLTGLELLEVSVSLEIQRRARSAFLRARNSVPLLADMASGIPDLSQVQHQIEASIGLRGDVLDSATPSLGILRQQTRDAYQRVTEALERIIHSSVDSEVLQDQVVSMRGDRLVLQVKIEQRHRMPGIVHDASNTGATLFIEPFATVDLCNTWRELVLEEQRETEKVLAELSALVSEATEDIERGAQLTASLDFILARARCSAGLKGTAPQTPPGPGENVRDGRARVRLLRARHPLLGDAAVPITVRIDPEWSVLVITGPNTGGKTVAMKTVGLLALMSQSGLHIPADEGSVLPVFESIYADIGDQQSVQGSVSTFGSHMRNVVKIIAHATPASLVLLDELGTSTDPEEGSALAKAILRHLASKRIKTIITTHHRSVAAFAEATPGMMNASVDLDPATLKPTYRLTIGVPGRSYAMSVAAQLGLPDAIMDEARSLLEPQHLRFEDWLNELQSERDQLKERLQRLEHTQARADAAEKKYEELLEDLEIRRADILHQMRGELADRFEDMTRKLRRIDASLSWDAPSGEPIPATEIKRARVDLTSVKKDIEKLEHDIPERLRVHRQRPLAVDDSVDVRGLNVRGRVVAIDEQSGEVEVSVGDVRFRLDSHRLSLPQEEEIEDRSDARIVYNLGPILSGLELHVRGLRVDDATLKVEEFLDKAVRDGATSVRIIHGKGTGTLRRAVGELLEKHPLVRSFAQETRERGGSGVTVVELM